MKNGNLFRKNEKRAGKENKMDKRCCEIHHFNISNIHSTMIKIKKFCIIVFKIII